jgi:hypothetical protein
MKVMIEFILDALLCNAANVYIETQAISKFIVSLIYFFLA